MYGPGGYGKSDAAVLFHKFLVQEEILPQDNRAFVMSFGQGMTEERLLGGIDMPTFKDTGELLYLLKKAFVNYEYVIFEEIWDAFPAVLLILKDILQSGEVRMGDQTMKIKTRMVVACTNRSRDEVVEDDSTEALMQRFHFEKEVSWKSFKKNDYLKSFTVASPTLVEQNPILANAVAEICEEVSTLFKSKGERPVSPRGAGKSFYSAICNDSIECLTSVHGFESETKKMMTRIKEMVKDDSQKELLIKSLIEIKTELKNEIDKASTSEEGVAVLIKTKEETRSVFNKNIRNANTDLAEECFRYFKYTLEKYFHNNVKLLVENKDSVYSELDILVNKHVSFSSFINDYYKLKNEKV